MLRTLQQSTAPGKQARDAILQGKYHKVCKAHNMREVFEEWQLRRETAFGECGKADLSGVQVDRSHFDFLDAMFIVMWKRRINNHIADSKMLTSVLVAGRDS